MHYYSLPVLLDCGVPCTLEVAAAASSVAGSLRVRKCLMTLDRSFFRDSNLGIYEKKTKLKGTFCSAKV